MKSSPILRLPEPVMETLAPPDSVKEFARLTTPEPSRRLMAWPLVPSLRVRSPPTVNDRSPTWMVWTASPVHCPSILPPVVSEPPWPRVRVRSSPLPKRTPFTVTGEVMMGAFLNGSVPRSATSLVEGGRVGMPKATFQFSALSHALLKPPTHRAALTSSERVHSPLRSVNAFFSTQLLASSFADLPTPDHGETKCQNCMLDSMLPLSSRSS